MESSWHRKIPELYLALSLLVATFLCLLTPPLYVPDEAEHIARALSLTQGHWLITVTPQGIGGDVNCGLVQIKNITEDRLKAQGEPRFPVSFLLQDQAVGWQNCVIFKDFHNTAQYPPPLYLPQIPGLLLGKYAGLSMVDSFRTARFTAMLVSILLGWLALRLCSLQWRTFFCALLLLPTVLSLAASCSQDSSLIPLAVLAASLLFRAIEANRLQSKAEMVSTGLALLVIAGARPPYALLLLLLFLPVLEKQDAIRKDYIGPTLVLLLSLLPVFLWRKAVSALPIPIAPNAAPADQLTFVSSHILGVSWWLSYDFLKQCRVLLLTGVYTIGLNNVFPSRVIARSFLLAFLCISYLGRGRGVAAVKSRFLLAGCILGVIAAMVAVEFITWTPVGVHRVDGLQARYLIPLLPLAVFFLPSAEKRPLSIWPRRLYLASLAFFLFCVISTPWVASHHFYGTGLLNALHTIR